MLELRSLSIRGGIAVLECGRRCISAINLKTGDKIWEFKTEWDIESISIKDNRVMLKCNGRRHIYIDLKTGRKIRELIIL
ncbi:TPA: PQQ-binding-like beta-propeller repeat protein [Methanocaldococcus jannaschii]|uniref:Uncharacterized protein MJECL22 n=2 Tax=Methanocaldococcus jannaschii TaxID=2190 RepID=Y3522_METJA|nr:PQQ-binding-like beta-propeller repeat protein [Methanocaldococcus jannaschii]Q60259.1 RecName: Full=Uncharacterized protein MJECL22 [Methanocaldococcus jannaschii DSM 2661]AAC37093.1 hypothetical protein MJ_ECL22 [Methanocaldococcus jannaschii DSM 2661]HII60087.1 PQQ-binding-like beta-propeller repeat protein [Methanocaldococcus jannaschii]